MSQSEELKVIEFEEKSSKLSELAQLQSDLEALNQIEKDFASVLSLQSSDLTIIEKKQDESVKESEETGKILKQAAVIQNRTWKIKFASKLTAIGSGLGLIVGPIGSAIGGAIGGITGAVIGKKISTANEKEINKVSFADKIPKKD